MTWLEQRQPGGDAVLLEDYPGKLVRIECSHCDRTGRYGLALLVQRFGPAAGLPDVLAALSADCPRRQDGRINGPCGAGFPDLVLRPPA
jgi:hypothetical protein